MHREDFLLQPLLQKFERLLHLGIGDLRVDLSDH